ncbi:hypothetical protein BABINDRAFT_67726 [Babjeviella inositovora NRRL Y-12698]|uniref:Uncharacterized protein n=1 Tax=Babjeviella inositovora NRRL Y-12698 TaxID=984486 RepID=A0A1E3QHM4_9ASCO|nr:uncharacterized protein BABINDRAFT_67726 [Babjeviella inositovora NRRL Y-12698]ODQ77213.1 hypothetical protein BABINDRAFT_67726 [Babjeviella inositovora NRRL Y-12698]
MALKYLKSTGIPAEWLVSPSYTSFRCCGRRLNVRDTRTKASFQSVEPTRSYVNT